MSSVINMPAPPNPVEEFLRSDRMPHIWCPGCGIGTTVSSGLASFSPVAKGIARPWVV